MPIHWDLRIKKDHVQTNGVCVRTSNTYRSRQWILNQFFVFSHIVRASNEPTSKQMMKNENTKKTYQKALIPAAINRKKAQICTRASGFQTHNASLIDPEAGNVQLIEKKPIHVCVQWIQIHMRNVVAMLGSTNKNNHNDRTAQRHIKRAIAQLN